MLSGSLLIALVSIAAIFDLRWHRIPNWLTLPAVIVGLFLGLSTNGVEGLKISAIGLAVGFVIFLVPFILGGMGGGDVKLMAAVGALIGWPLIVWAILLSCVVAIFATVAKAIWKGRFSILLLNTWQILRNTLVGVLLRRPVEEIKMVTKIQAAVYVPFGAAIAVGTGWALVLQYLVERGIVTPLPLF